MSSLTGTVRLVRAGLRRDRVNLPSWIGGLAVFFVYVTTAIPAAYELDELSSMTELLAGPVGRLLVGPGYGFDDLTYARVVANGYGLYFMLAVALMSILTVVRHTRAEEQSGRAELIRASVVGPNALLAAAIVIAVIANLAVGIAGLVVLVGMAGYELAGSALLVAACVGVGLAWTGVAVVTVQLTEHSRAASGMAGGVLGAAFLLRAVGDMASEGGSTLSWASPLGWGQQTAPFVLDRWWPLLLLVGFAAATTVLGVVLSRRRDFGSGIISTKPGNPRAQPHLGTPVGLAARLQRGLILGWGLSLVASGLVFGIYADGLQAAIDDLPEIFLDLFGTEDLLVGYLAYTATFFAYLTACYLIMVVQGLRSEETVGLGESLLATPMSRVAWAGSAAVVAIPAAVAILAVAGVATGVGAAIVTGQADLTLDLLAAHVNQIPPVLLVLGVTMLLFGWAPRLLPAAWILPVYGMLAGTFGEILDLPSLVLSISPFAHGAAVPLEAFAVVPAVVLTLLGVTGLAAGLAGLRRREIEIV